MDFDSLARTSSVDWIGQAAHQPLQPGARAELPDQDPFYEPPAGFEHAQPGTVLRSRDVELAFLGLIPQRLHATQLLYRTTDRNGLPQATVTTVLVPGDRDLTRPCPIVSYQCAIDAVDGRCFPSYALRRRAKAYGSFTQLEFVLIAAMLAQGWAVSVPDHEGRDGHWGAPYEPGYCVLDGLRAALGSEQLELAADSPIGLWGYSGGGLATGWAAEVCGSYAPELNVAGAAMGSPVGDLGNTLMRLNGSFWSGLPATMIAALARTYPDLAAVIDEHATVDGRALLHSLESTTTAAAVLRFQHRSLNSYIDQPLEQLIEMPAVQHVFDDTRLGSSVPAPPMLMVQAIYDEVISVHDIDALAATYAAGGARLTYHRDLFSEHILLHPLSTPMVLSWLADRFAGRPVPETVVQKEWPTLLNPKTYLGLARLGLVAVRVITARALR
ncbi:lipase family protein [Mycolicibacter sp. MYC123]|uniref:Lipase family protein n=1 Tax=[Mycobacterium] zoologicum TaxID=2872311 RepID=A0ABU5YEP3_9MYCO|nr:MULTISPECIES: lipase family protein [unclassified Mycolicibacter]MEB3048516.1 lipase family protein [Mycolicibacter sp. MYC123]MEB3064937.1 lipase family protein [Mycolicibacter sp. MYC101]